MPSASCPVQYYDQGPGDTHRDTQQRARDSAAYANAPTPPCKACSGRGGNTPYKGVLQSRENTNKQTRKDDLLWQTVLDGPR